MELQGKRKRERMNMKGVVPHLGPGDHVHHRHLLPEESPRVDVEVLLRILLHVVAVTTTRATLTSRAAAATVPLKV